MHKWIKNCDTTKTVRVYCACSSENYFKSVATTTTSNLKVLYEHYLASLNTVFFVLRICQKQKFSKQTFAADPHDHYQYQQIRKKRYDKAKP